MEALKVLSVKVNRAMLWMLQIKVVLYKGMVWRVKYSRRDRESGHVLH